MLVSRTSLFAAMLTLAAIAGIASASAQDDIRKRGDKACGHDSRRMCSKFFGDDMQVLACLQNNKVRLAKSCHKFLTDIGQLN
ncbi:MAG: hypothetical protein E6G97_19585 [Alphaproteobacteria bacterium]|nr:MAG: hypothetical protein E6G97_19585 [Alphaproteobacteria bacterium]